MSSTNISTSFVLYAPTANDGLNCNTLILWEKNETYFEMLRVFDHAFLNQKLYFKYVYILHILTFSKNSFLQQK